MSLIKKSLGVQIPVEMLWESTAHGAVQMTLQEVIQQLLDQFDGRRQETIECLLREVPVEQIAKRTGSSKRTVYRIRQTALHVLERILAAP